MGGGNTRDIDRCHFHAMIRFGEILTVSHINYLSLLLNRSWLDEIVTEADPLKFWFDLGNCALGILA